MAMRYKRLQLEETSRSSGCCWRRGPISMHRADYYGNALQAASARGNEPIVRLLLEKGANINVQGGGYGNALQAALAQGNEPIVRLAAGEGGQY